ncbi:MAG: CoA transferase [Dehalococcoidia bacterium]|nr:MAG: CoA transferase [Dehalococcoidia bacterium]
MAGALDGVRVIDFGQYIAGPLVAQLLGDQGAEVIRVDPPGGPRWDTPANATWNRGKRSIALDLKTEGGLSTARGLIARGDVVVENFRPGVMDRLGLGAVAMTEANPRLVYCSLPGFAADDPRAGYAAWEGVVGAAAGMYRAARGGTPSNGRPIYSAIPLPSSYAAIQAAVAIAMALGVRERDGVGQVVTVPLFDGMFGAIGYDGLRVHKGDLPPMGAGVSLTTQFECADGRWVMFHTGNGRTQEVLDAAGVGQWVRDGLIDRERLAKNPEAAREMVEEARALFKTRPAAEWEALVNAAGGECAVCRPSAEWLTHEHALGSSTVVEVDDPILGKARVPGVAARLTLTPGAVAGPRRPLDADRAEVLALASATPEIAPAAPAPPEGLLRNALDGVRVLDLCIVLAGPTCGRTLAEYGADVIKIEAPGRPPGFAFHGDVNRGKRSIVLDLKTPEGREAFWKLVEGADVVVQNFRKDVAAKLGISYEQVKAKKPDIVYASLNTYGHVGPFAGRAGHEQIAQAATGMQERFGGDGQPQLQKYAVNDYGTGFLGAYAVGLALLHRRRTGEGQHVDAALAYTATLLQSAFMQDYAGKIWDEPCGQAVTGSEPLHRAYKAIDVWLFLAAPDVSALERVEGLAGVESLSGAALEAALEERIGRAPLATWEKRLAGRRGVAMHRVVQGTRELMDHPWAREHGLSIAREHDDVGMVTTIGPAARLSRTPLRPGRPAPALGGQTREILAEAGLGERADALIASGGVRESMGIAR